MYMYSYLIPWSRVLLEELILSEIISNPLHTNTIPKHYTYSMVQSRNWEANWFAASQETYLISRNPKVHYRTHKRPPPVSILGQPPVHISTSHLLEIHPNIIHPSTPRSPQWSLSIRFPHEDPIHPPFLTHTRHMHSPSHSSWLPKHYTFVYSYFLRHIPVIHSTIIR